MSQQPRESIANYRKGLLTSPAMLEGLLSGLDSDALASQRQRAEEFRTKPSGERAEILHAALIDLLEDAGEYRELIEMNLFGAIVLGPEVLLDHLRKTA